jgi:hypothetical protein
MGAAGAPVSAIVTAVAHPVVGRASLRGVHQLPHRLFFGNRTGRSITALRVRRPRTEAMHAALCLRVAVRRRQTVRTPSVATRRLRGLTRLDAVVLLTVLARTFAAVRVGVIARVDTVHVAVVLLLVRVRVKQMVDLQCVMI